MTSRGVPFSNKTGGERSYFLNLKGSNDLVEITKTAVAI